MKKQKRIEIRERNKKETFTKYHLHQPFFEKLWWLNILLDNTIKDAIQECEKERADKK